MATPKASDKASLADQDLSAAWERWWSGIGRTPGEIVWDADPGDLEADLGHFAGWFGQALPVVDVGCGDGRQTRFLARHFPHVAGVDVSAAAIGRARAVDNPPNVCYQVLDARDPAGAARLHGELGDANVYIRGVLQALPPPAGPGRSRPSQPCSAPPGRCSPRNCRRKPPPTSLRSSSGTACRPAWPRSCGTSLGTDLTAGPGRAVPRRPVRGDQHRDQPHAHRQHPARRRGHQRPGDLGPDPSGED